MKFQIGLILTLCAISANTFVLNNQMRVKRSPQDSFFSKVKTGFTNFATDVKKITSKGVEEVKNLFSSDRNVGDYRIDQIDVRFGEDEEENGTFSGVENTNKIENPDFVQRDKREVNEEIIEQAMDDVLNNLEDQLVVKNHTTEGGLPKSTTLQNNAEQSPGFPPAKAETSSILFAPSKCPDGQKLIGARCRTII